MKLPLVAGKDKILVVCNRLSKITYFIAITKGTSAEELASLFKIMCRNYIGCQKV